MKKEKKLEYSEGFIAFLDILGFTKIVEEDDLSKIENCYSAIRGAINDFTDTNYFDGDLKATIISDSVIISIEKNDSNLGYRFKQPRKMLAFIQEISRQCLIQGVWLRGHLTFGKFYHNLDESNMVGPAFIEAYRNESRNRYPRVTINPKVWEAFSLSVEEFANEMSFDGKTYINQDSESGYLFNKDGEVFVEYVSPAISSNISFLLDQINEKAKTIPPEAHLKYVWLKEYVTLKIETSQGNDHGRI